MRQAEKEKIKRFVADKEMFGAVKNTLLKTYIKKGEYNDIHMLAAAKIAIDLLEDGFREIIRVSNQSEPADKKAGNVGF